jgi:coproporphyrinogen III oxidase
MKIQRKNDMLDYEPSLSPEDFIESLYDINSSFKDVLTPDMVKRFLNVRETNKSFFTDNDPEAKLTLKPWHSTNPTLQGGGVMTMLRGEILEKSCVNMSLVYGSSYPGSEKGLSHNPFVACGVSLISHPKNPYCPIMHMNVRLVAVLLPHNEIKAWIGGGADLTPMVRFDEDVLEFEGALKEVTLKYSDDKTYEAYKTWADEYFYIPHRQEIRGSGGIFFDFIPYDKTLHPSFLQELGEKAGSAYHAIINRRKGETYTEKEREAHCRWRARYAEFNLVYDRGTRFGLMSGGNYEAIFCSLPPVVLW